MAAKRRHDRRWDATPEPAPVVAPAPPAPVESVDEPEAPVVEVALPPAPAAAPVPSGLVVVRVRGPGSVIVDRVYVAGEEMVLTLTNALSLGEAVEVVG